MRSLVDVLMRSSIYVCVGRSEADYACAVLFDYPTFAEHYSSFIDDDCTTTVAWCEIRHMRNQLQPSATSTTICELVNTAAYH